MSSTRQGARKTGADNYPTPDWCIRRFLEEWDDLDKVGKRWLEPAVGDGIIPEIVDKAIPGIEWTTCDIRDTSPALRRVGLDYNHHVGDFFQLPTFSVESGNRWDVAILNPPFRLTLEFIQRCLMLARVVVVMQRINYLGTEDRNAWFRGNMPDLYVIPNRVSFTGNGKADSVENAWHVWGPHRSVDVGELRLLKNTPLKERKKSRRRIIRARDDVEVTLDALFDEVAFGDTWANDEVAE